MGFRARKSISLGGGVRLNVGKTGVGLSAGGRGLRYSVHSSGRTTRTVGVPGSGVSYSKSRGGGSRGARSRPQPVSAGLAAEKPGLLAPGYEKAFHKGLTAFVKGDTESALRHFADASERDQKGKASSDDLFAGALAVMAEQPERAIPYLESVVASDVPLPDALMLKYAPGLSIKVGITDRTSVQVELGSLAAVLLLAECYERESRTDDAIGLVQQLSAIDPDPALTLSLCELLASTESWDEIVDAAAGIKNDDDVSLEICLYQAQALEAQGMTEPALEVLKDALRARSRSAELLTAARYSRGRLLLNMGKTAQGRKDLARVYADDPGYLDVAALLDGN